MDALLAIRLPAEVKEQVEQWAAEDDRSVSSFLRRLIEAERARRTQSAQSPKVTKTQKLPEAA
jgi:predicted transcriptional regulator